MQENDLIQSLEAINDKTIAYLTQLSKSQESKAVDILIDRFNLFELSKEGTIVTNAKNISHIQTLIEDYRNYIFTNEFTKKIQKQLYKHYADVSKITNKYYNLSEQEFGNKALLKELQANAIISTINDLQTAGIDATRLNKAFQAIVTDNLTLKQASDVFRKSVPKQLDRYTNEIVTDNLYQYERNVTKILTNDLQLKHYFYSGTLRETSRPFCKNRAGRVFTEAEVRSWGNMGEWEGKIPGTNSKTIFTYLGGYNCRHRLIPITQERFDKLNKK